MAIDPQREARRARILIPLGILLIVGSAALLVVGILAVTSLELDSMWMLFVGGFGLFPGIFMTVAGFHARGSARYAAGTGWKSPMGATPMAGGTVCSSCGNLNPAGATVCGSCGAKLA